MLSLVPPGDTSMQFTVNLGKSFYPNFPVKIKTQQQLWGRLNKNVTNVQRKAQRLCWNVFSIKLLMNKIKMNGTVMEHQDLTDGVWKFLKESAPWCGCWLTTITVHHDKRQLAVMSFVTFVWLLKCLRLTFQLDATFRQLPNLNRLQYHKPTVCLISLQGPTCYSAHLNHIKLCIEADMSVLISHLEINVLLILWSIM